MSRLEAELARRIDSLARRAHAFHRYAHHPLCTRYACEVLRIGRCWMCKGCCFVTLGGTAGAMLGAFLPAVQGTAALLIIALSNGCFATWCWNLRFRTSKILTRLLPAMCVCGTAATLSRSCASLWPLVACTIAAAWVTHGHSHRRPWRQACVDCPESSHVPCSGFSLQLRRERAFVRLSHRWIDRGGHNLLPLKQTARARG